MAIYNHGQGATEYLVLLAIVLIIALVAIGILGFYPGLATDAKRAQSDAYWRGEARPFAILEHSQSGSMLTFSVLNNEGEINALENISLAVSTASNKTYYPIGLNSSVTFLAGERKTINASIGALNCSASGNVYSYDIQVNYSSSNGVEHVQVGSKPLLGRCS